MLPTSEGISEVVRIGWRVLKQSESASLVTFVFMGSGRYTCYRAISEGRSTSLTLSLPRVINVKCLLHPHQKYYITQYEELGFSWLTQMKDD